MTDKKKWRTAAKYGMGMAGLAACVAAAWFFPEAYGIWKDRQNLGRVELSYREPVSFLDENSLDVQSRWQFLAQNMDHGYEITDNDYAWYLMERDQTALTSRCREILEIFLEEKLIPFGENDSPVSLRASDAKILYLNGTMIPLGIFEFYQSGGMEPADIFTVILDLETQMSYYVSGMGGQVWEGMAKELGYDSYEHMQALESVGTQIHQTEEISIDFASVFGADSAELFQERERLEKNAELQFGEYTVSVYRSVVCRDNSYYGVGIFVGNLPWNEILSQSNLLTMPYGTEPGWPLDQFSDTFLWKSAAAGMF